MNLLRHSSLLESSLGGRNDKNTEIKIQSSGHQALLHKAVLVPIQLPLPNTVLTKTRFVALSMELGLQNVVTPTIRHLRNEKETGPS